MSWGSLIKGLVDEFFPKPPPPLPVAISLSGLSPTSAAPSAAQVATGLPALISALTVIQAGMAKYQGAIVAAEDVLQALAILGVPGAAAAETGLVIADEYGPEAIEAAEVVLPWLAPLLTGWLASGAAFAPNSAPNNSPQWGYPSRSR